MTEKMSFKFLLPSALNTDMYNAWKKEMQIWKLAISLDIQRHTPIVLLSPEGKAIEAYHSQLTTHNLNENKTNKPHS